MSVWDATASRLGVTKVEWTRLAATGALVAVTLLMLFLGHKITERFYWNPGSVKLYLPFAGAAGAALLFATTRYADFTTPMRACMRASAVGLTVLLALESPDYTLANPETAARAAEYVKLGYWLALTLSVAAWFRPSFMLPTAVFLLSTRHLVYAISGVPLSFLDTRFMLDMAIFLVVFGIFAVKLGARVHPWLGATDRQNEILGVVMGLHLGNYFWSGVAKLVAGPTPWYWVLQNKTFNQIPYTIESGILPLGHIPWLTDLAYEGFKIGYVPLNAAILVAQLFAVVCVLRIGWLKIASVLYELLHLGIYVLGGLFFWPWIWNNVTVWWSARSAPEGLAVGTKAACILTILLGAPALKLNEAAWLAWFDVADARQVYFEAITADGRAVKTPSAFFNSHSYGMSHAYLGSQPLKGQYEHTMLASTDSVERNEKDGTCAAPDTLAGPPPETVEARTERQARLRRFIVAHHAKMLAREQRFGLGSYYLHLHHHPSNPFLYPEFNRLSLKDVVGYRQVLESVCHGMKDGRVTKRVIARDTEYVSVR